MGQIQVVIEVRRKFRTRFGHHRQRFRAKHPLSQAIAQFIHFLIVRPHALLHDLRRHSDHVRVANPPPLHHP